MKNWMTTVGAVIGSALVVLGFIWPDKVDIVTQEVIRTATAEIIAGVGILINVITGLLAKDPVLPKIVISSK
jgi:hypothetical protein